MSAKPWCAHDGEPEIIVFCPLCNQDIPLDNPWDLLMDDWACPHCQGLLTLWFEEHPDGDRSHFYAIEHDYEFGDLYPPTPERNTP